MEREIFILYTYLGKNNGQNDEASILRYTPTLTLETGVTNCQRGLREEKEKHKTGEKCQACTSGRRLEPRWGRTCRTGRAERGGLGRTPRWAGEGEQAKRFTLIMRDRQWG